ncbi:MAG: TetR/AcrR family transcriptional regulator [Clostridia bacterium]|nr:TetR/AcrR family transcriptional regulator [Clostridia bacterium]
MKRDLHEDILNVASEFLKTYGYEGTTFQKIADELGITKGAITYHFKNKYYIMDALMEEFFRKIRQFIDQYPLEYRNTYWRYCVMYIYAYRVIMSCGKNIDLFYHKDQMSLWEQTKVTMVYHNYESIARDFHKDFTENELQVTTFFDLGARRRLYREYMNQTPLLMEIDNYAYYHIELMGMLAHLDRDTIKTNIKAAFDFVNTHDASHIEMLPRKRQATEE